MAPEIGLSIPKVLLPRPGIDLTKWAVIACDQYNQDIAYWEKVKEFAGDGPSTLNNLLPEAWLSRQEELIPQIQKNMWSCLEQHLEECGPGFILVERVVSGGGIRKGLVAALDLEKYGRNGLGSLARATENTLPDKLALRKRIRRGAPIELPHTLTLIDDRENTVIEPLSDKHLETLYDFELMMNGGRIRGRLIKDEETIRGIANKLTRLADPELQANKYGLQGMKPILFADGDGNHAMASAKAIWEESKADLPKDHPLRYTLVEIVNIHDTNVQFKPIHRVVHGKSLPNLLDEMRAYYGGGTSVTYHSTEEDAVDGIRSAESGMHSIRFRSGETHGVIRIKPMHELAVGTLQRFLDFFPERGVDYVHGEANADFLSSQKDSVGFYLPPMPKAELFRTIIVDGVLPKKAFSIGEANDKRFYLEARKLF
jgi:hypothetical protein